MRRSLLIGISLLTLAGLAGCTPPPRQEGAERSVAATPEAASEQLYAWLEAAYEEEVARSPMRQTSLGRKTNNDKWDDPSDAAAVADMEWRRGKLAEMKATFNPAKLDDAGRLNFRLYEFAIDEAERAFAWRDKGYAFSQFGGPHQNTPPFLINFHKVDTVADAEAYVGRLESMDDYLDGARAVFEARAAKGVLPPAFAFPQMTATARNVISGAPFTEGDANPVYADISGKIDALSIDADAKAALKARAETALLNNVRPAFERLIGSFEALGASATSDDGVWKLPDGEAYYNARLAASTTTPLTADEIHEIGLAQFARIHAEMQTIMTAVGFEGTLEEFFAKLRTDPQFYYPNTDEGREAYLAEATRVIDEMTERLDELFYTKPKAPLVVKRVEPFREKSAGIASYNSPSEDGTRPGIYYVNLTDMAAMPKYQLEAIAYHEGAPGHHMQRAIAQELDGVPSFRKFGGYTAYSEGWGLYSEDLPKELGLYQDPYSDFGRLGTDAWRAARLVVDTGLHAKKWTREEAISFMLKSAPLSEEQARKEIERYVVIPGQATSYMIGKLKIRELRARATEQLGERFDVKAFHDLVLANGAVPLPVLEEIVDGWIAIQLKAS